MSALRPFCMPKWGIEMTEGTIAEWMVAEGTRLSRGDVMCLIETDKITNEVEAERDGVLLRIVEGARDEALPVGTLLAVIGDADADAAAVDSFVAAFVPADGGTGRARKAVETAERVEERQPAATSRAISPQALALAEAEGIELAGVAGSGRNGRITYQDVHQAIRPPARPNLKGPASLPAEDRKVFASPLARRLADLHGIDLAALTGTGPRGRISRADVLGRVTPQASATSSDSKPFASVDNTPEIVPFDKLQRVAARRLGDAKRDIPHFYLRASASADALLGLRKTANLVLGCSASVNDIIVMAAARALTRHPKVNVQVHGDEVHRFAHADIGIAVASPKGLVAPILRQADRMTLPQLAAASKALVERAREGRLAYDDLDGGTFSVSNLGMFGVESFDAIINPPQAAILAVGKAARRAVETDDGDIAFATRIALTLSLDHRAIDGATGAQFLATLVSLIEQPEQLFA